MADAQIEQLKAKFLQRLRGARFLPEIKARTGKLASATAVADDPKVYDLAGALVPNLVYVRVGATRESPAGRSQTTAWNYDKVATDKSDLPVILVEDASGDLYVDRADAAAANTFGTPEGFYGNDAARPSELRNDTAPLATIEDFKSVWDSDLDGLYVYVGPGWYDGVHWPGGSINAADYITATSDRKAWVAGVFDKDAGAIVAGTGSDMVLSLIPTPQDDIPTTIEALGVANRKNLFAVAIPNGATTNAGLMLIDIREMDGGGGRTETTIAASVGTTTYDIDFLAATKHELTLTGNPTFTFSNLDKNRSVTLVLIQDGAGGRTVTWPGTSANWPNGAPTLKTGAGERDVITVFVLNDDATWLGFSATEDTGAGTVTDVTATSPLASSGGTTPDISLGSSGVAAGTYTRATVTVNEFGLVTAIEAGGAIGQYRQFLYALDGLGDFTFLTTTDGHPLTALMDLE